MMNTTQDGFYVTGGTLRPDAPSYITRQADAELYTSLSQGEFCYVLTSRQMGKSSLMIRTAIRLRQDGVAVAVLDLTAFGQNLTPEQWYEGMLARVGQQLDMEDALDDFWETHKNLGPLQRWMDAIQHVVLTHRTSPVVIFVDEIDYVRSLSFATDEFFAAIRECYNRRTENPVFNRLTFCLLGVATPSDLISDPRTTPFNIGRRIELADFSIEDAVPLIAGLGREASAGRKLLKRILHWTGGHPYLTQRLCLAVAKMANVANAADVDRHCNELFLSSRARERDANLQFVRNRLLLLQDETERANLLDLYTKVRNGRRIRDDDTNPFIAVLHLSGITRVVQGLLRVRNRIYQHVFDRAWINTNLPDAERRRQRAAFWKGVAGTAAVVLPLIFAGLWYWDAYYREHVAYYGGLITRWGSPEGIRQLTNEQVRRRHTTLKFIRQGRSQPVEEIRIVNGREVCPLAHFGGFILGPLNPLENMTEDSFLTISETMATCRVTFERDSADRVIGLKAYNRGGRLLYELRYASPNTLYYREGEFPQARRGSGITHVKFVRPESGPEAGLDQEIHYYDAQGEPQPDRYGSFGQRHVFNDQGLIIETISLGKNGQPAVNNLGVAKEKTEFDKHGNLTTARSFGYDGRLIPGAEGVTSTKITYDIYGNLTKFAFFGLDGQRITVRELGAAGRTWRYDDNGNVIETTFFGPDEQLVRTSMGFAKITLEYHEDGGVTETYFGPDGKPMRIGGFVKGKVIRDERGYVTSIATFDEHGQPVYADSGCHQFKFAYDGRGNRTESACLNETEQPIRTMEGFAKAHWVYDDHGNKVETAFFDPDGQPGLYEETFVKLKRKYNQQGKIVEETYYDKADRLIKRKDGYAKITYDRDQQGNIVEVKYFDEDGYPTQHKDGYAKIVGGYDARGNLIEKATFDSAGRPVRGQDGYAKAKFAYDRRGYRIATAYFDEGGQATLHKDGYAKIRKQYNEKGRLIEQSSFGLDNALTVHKNGYAKWRKTYDSRGNLKEEAYFDTHDQLVRTAWGYAKIQLAYDDLEREIERIYFDEDGTPVQTHVTIEDVEEGSKGHRIGLQEGDIILEYAGETVGNMHTFTELRRTKRERPRDLKIMRNGNILTIPVDPGLILGIDVIDKVPQALRLN